MFGSLYSKLALVLTGLFFLMGLVFIAVMVFSTEMYQQEVNQKLNFKLAEQIVAQNLLMKDDQVNETALKEVFHMLMVINPSIEIYLLDSRGRILSFSAPQGKVKLNRVDLNPIRKWLEGDMELPLLGDDPRHPGRKKVFTAARIPDDGKVEGYLYVILGGEMYDSMAEKMKGSYILQLSSWLIFASLLFSLITGLIFFAVLTGRLKRLANGMDDFKRGRTSKELDLRLRKNARMADEIDRLGSTFKEMAQRIEGQMQQMKTSDKLRRELVANVSHDLRTPLANLHGYIETLILKEQHLTDTDRRNYLQIALKHCERLNKLVSELLELARLEALESKVACEPFNLAELIQDVTQKFQWMAENKQINVISNIQDGLPFVHADIGLIERVVENLLENAIHYTPCGGEVRIVLTPEDDHNVSIQIKDTGQGVPEEEIPHIFNRFYQLKSSPKNTKGHSGLGLAITKRILQLHNEDIHVSTRPGSGTTFMFQLPIHLSA